MVANPVVTTTIHDDNFNAELTTMRSILVALDGSPPSMAALQEAVDWAVKLKSELRGVFVEDERRFVYYPSAASFEGGMARPATGVR